MSSEMEKKSTSSRREAASGKSSKSSGKTSGSSSGDLTGKNLGKFAVVRKIGSGGMGAVYLARDSVLDRMVALKILPPEKAENPTLVKRFRAEARASAMLDHDNIVGVYDSGEIDGLNYISMEYIDGIDVSDLIKRKGTVGVKRSIDIVRQIAMALEHAHERNIVHRDIKPSNFMITREGIVKLADMGLARAIDEMTETSITRAGSTVGTIDYMAPEQARSSKAADTRSDLYSLGCAWFHMLAGHPPYNEGSVTNKLQAHAVAPFPDLRQINENVPLGVIAMISRLMAKRPEERYQTPAELLEDLSNENILRSDIAEEGLDALAREVVEEKARKPSKSTLPPKEKRLAKIDNESSGFLEAVVNFVPVLIVAGISVGVIALMWWGLSGFSGALSGSGGQANLQKGDEESENKELLNNAGQSLVEKASDPRLGNNAATSQPQNSVNASPATNLQEVVTPNRLAVSSGTTQTAEVHPVRLAIADDWGDLERLPAQRLSSGKNFEPVDQLLDALLNSPESKTIVIELADNGPYVLKSPHEIKADRFILKPARGMQPVLLFLPEAKPSSKEPTYLLHFKNGRHLIDGVEFATILGEVGQEHSSDFIRIADGAKLDVINSAFTQEGFSQTGSRVTAVRLLPSVISSSLRCFQNLYRGEDLTAFNLNANFGDAEFTRCLALIGVAPVIRVEDPDEGANPAVGQSVQRTVTTRECLLASGNSILDFDAAKRLTVSPITRFVADKTSFIQWPQAGTLQSPQRSWIIGQHLTPDLSSTGAGSFEQYLRLELSQLQLSGYEHLISAQTQQGNQLVISSIGELEAKWNARWLELATSPALTANSAFRDLASRTSEVLDLVLNTPSPAPFSLSSLKSFEGRFIRRASLERQFVLQSSISQSDIDPLFEGAETFRIEIPRQKLQDVLNNERLPTRAIIEIRGTGEIEIPPTLIEDRLLRIDFGKPGDIILRPLEVKSTVALRAEDKLPYESLITIRNGILDLRNATIVLTPTKTLNSPIWALTSDRGHLLVDRCQLVGPLLSDSLHAGLIRQVSRTEPPIGKPVPGLASASTLVTNSLLFSPRANYESEVLPSRLKFHNTAFVSLDNAITLGSISAATNSLASRPRIELSNLTISSGQTALTVAGDGKKPAAAVPVVIQNCVFAPRLDIKSDAPQASLFNLQNGAESFSFWWFNNGITSTRPAITPQITQSGNTTPPGWDLAWKPGHEASTLFGPDGVLMQNPLPEPKNYEVADLTLNSTCKAITWSTSGGPIGAEIKQLEELFKPTSAGTRNIRDVQTLPDGKIIRPGF